MEALKSQRGYTELEGAHVFHNPHTDKPWNSDNAIREGAWKTALKRAKVRYRYPYQTRHTYACLMLTAGENPAWIADQMGHADWGMIPNPLSLTESAVWRGLLAERASVTFSLYMVVFLAFLVLCWCLFTTKTPTS